MCCNFPTIKITEGNAFTLIFPLKRRSYLSEKPIDDDIDVTRLTDVHVTLGGVEYAPTIETYGVRIDVPSTLARGTYDGLLTAEYDGNAIRGAYESCVQIVAWNLQSNAQQYILGSPVATNAAYVLGYMPTDTEVEALKQQLRDQIAAAEQAEAEAIAEKQRYAEALEHLDDIAKESTLIHGVSDIRNDIANIDIDTSDLAKEATAQQAAIDAAAAKMAAQALSPIAQAADAYNTGKVELAANITAKGVEASASETLPQLAQKITAIAQQPIILYPSEVGDMYAVQQFGSITIPNYWNLYEVLNTLLNDGRLLNYGGIMLAEYDNGYDSINLNGAGSGGAYVVSDMDNGIFKMYTEDTTHTWSTEFDGKGNRWVAYCFAEEYHDFQITDKDKSPQSIFIGRKVGTIKSFVDSRCGEIVVPDGNELKNIDTGTFKNNFGKSLVVKGLYHQEGRLLYNNQNVEKIYVEGDYIGGELTKACYNFRTLIIKANVFNGSIVGNEGGVHYNFNTIIIDAPNINATLHDKNIAFYTNNWNECFIITEKCNFGSSRYNDSYTPRNIKRVNIFYKDNDKTKSVRLWGTFYYTEDVILQDGWNKNLIISDFLALTEENIYTHILQRLKQDEQGCGDGVTITLGHKNLDKLTREESIALLDDLTNIYGYTFA